MAHQEPNEFHHPHLPSLRVDSLRAHRQNQDAVILPIVYELSDPGYARNPDSLIIPISLPIRQVTTVVTSLQNALGELERKQNLALLKKKLDAPRKRPAKPKTSPTQPKSDLSSANPPGKTEPNKHLQTVVPALLLSVILLVVFAWMCFR
ncbi:MAG: hypothetical protein JST85_05390 [Acidobacteria bacterium]|nr:hypothetical protein [Acidobacteriota bacterium]